MSALGDDRTIFQPAGAAEVGAAPERPRGGLAAGALLNNIYEVRRFLARGGMGEVYEGVNVNTDERVAIKVMLPHLAADPKVQAMFRKEARILTELAHPALVRYRVLAHEPQLGLFYIVTEFIDGRPLSDVLGKLRPSAAELAALIRRLAEGLGAAHALGAVHRDMSPDNVLLPQDRLEHAKIIDFGIARESNLGHQTVIGDGFAGKLGYVAPEQLGDFGRRIGPWTDVYSLGLVALAVADGRDPDLGSTLVAAVDRRREGVDLTPVPPLLAPVFAGMLAPDPAQRFQSMEAVIAALDDLVPQGEPYRTPPAPPPEARRSPAPWVLGAGAAALLLAAGLGFALSAGRPKHDVAPVETAEAVPSLAAVPATPFTEDPKPAAPPAAAPAPAGPAKAAPAKAPAAPDPAYASVAEPAPLPHHAAVAPAPAAPAPAPARPADASADAAVQACWRAVDGAWVYLGYASRQGCVAQVFTSCQTIHGRWGENPLRRYDGKLQARGGGLIPRWHTVGESACPAEAPAP